MLIGVIVFLGLLDVVGLFVDVFFVLEGFLVGLIVVLGVIGVFLLFYNGFSLILVVVGVGFGFC